MDLEASKALPKVVLHDHLDGGLRVKTLIALAAETGYQGLPTSDPSDLATFMLQNGSGSLSGYLASFQHTIAVMQTTAAIERVAYESGVDHAADGVVYAEIRFAPRLLTAAGLAGEATIEAVLAGLARANADTGIVCPVIVSALRQDSKSIEVAEMAARYAGDGVVGFDLAGAEVGFSAADHLAAVNLARDRGLAITLHAGEADGLESIAAAVDTCGAQRIGHGVRIIDDCEMADGEIVSLGPLAARIHDERIPLEVSITSNIHIGLAPSAAAHPFGALLRAGFNVSINTDNRLMSGVTMSDEMLLAASTYRLELADLAMITQSALAAGFGDPATRRRLADDVIVPGYAALN